ncbi:MAG: hypothetical protein IJZ80_05915, partial [Clostridia bacterium]|nr:hypothetical protein [Clostridia bacterium]
PLAALLDFLLLTPPAALFDCKKLRVLRGLLAILLSDDRGGKVIKNLCEHIAPPAAHPSKRSKKHRHPQKEPPSLGSFS